MSSGKEEGKLIAFEGVDGCGKTTQIRILEERLKEEDRSVLKVEEPGGTPLGRRVRDILLNQRDLNIEPLTELMLYQTSRAQLIREKIRPALGSGTTVLMDRFYLSSIAYQGYGRGVNLRTVRELNEMVTGGLTPDLTVFIRLPLEEILNRKEEAKPDRIEKEDVNFYRRVMEGFDEAIQSEPETLVLSGTESKENLSKEIYERIRDLIG